MLDTFQLYKVYLYNSKVLNNTAHSLGIIYLFLSRFRFEMGKFWNALSYNFDKNNLQYISTIEARDFPFVGVQFHPEKNIFEWATNTVGNIPHSE